MKVSCGVVITDGHYLLGCLPFFKPATFGNYDIPKGGMDSDETPLETAKRELKEETGLDMDALGGHLTDFGRHPYISGKQLHLFVLEVDSLPDLDSLYCDSFFTFQSDKLPEVQEYLYIPLSNLQWLFPRLQTVVEAALDEVGLIKLHGG